MIVVLILAILAAILIPTYANASGTAVVSAVATDLRSFERATGMFALEVNGDLPLTNEEFRIGLDPYLEPGATTRTPAIGGNYGFHVWATQNVAGIGVWGVEHPELLVDIDARIDDANLASGAVHGVTSTGLLFVVYGDASKFNWP